MSEIRLHIDGAEVTAQEGMTVLRAAKEAGIRIPTLCHHEMLEPYGGCRICTVEIESRGRTSLVAACLYPVEQGLLVRTRSEKVDKIRKVLVEFLLSHAPDSPILDELAREYGADPSRFRRESSFCLLCGLCVRYCAEIKKKNAVGFVENGGKRIISFVPEIAIKECWNCKECFPLCPTSYLQAAYFLTEGLSLSTDAVWKE
ncbi:MAG: (2Fe-2S)-binding protein [Syntrophobacterales bacterium]|jgi:NADH dehydrogenase/NADH:ubiquinone oxidoreductase subunit G|nr:(2Fe-2S)-binding protein [Syntrophobacterales bacterium]